MSHEFIQKWAIPIGLFFTLISAIYGSITVGLNTGGLKERITAVEKNVDRILTSIDTTRASLEGRIESVRTLLEGNQGVLIRITGLEMRVEDLKRLEMLRDQRFDNIRNDNQKIEKEISQISEEMKKFTISTFDLIKNLGQLIEQQLRLQEEVRKELRRQ